MMETFSLARFVADVLAEEPSADALEFDERWYSWGELDATSRRIDAVIDEHAPGPEPVVGVLVRNSPLHVAALLAVLRRGGCFVVINPSRGEDTVRADVAELALPLVLGSTRDVQQLDGCAPTSALVAFADADAQAELAQRPAVPAATPHHPGVAVRMLTSGTTGPPKRIDLGYDALAGGIGAGKDYESTRSRGKRPHGVAIVNSPMAHLGGVFRVLQCVLDRRRFVLLERFEMTSWLRAVRQYRPATVSLVPTALRMVLEADPDPSDLASLKAVTSGTAPLSPEDADAFTARYGVPVLSSYAATEFAGGVAGWTLPSYRTYWQDKRGSVGQATPGSAIRVVDEQTGTPLAADEPGLLEVKPAQLADTDWVRTNDLARIDGDGFLFILGRADHAIIRGGFKVLPDRVRSVLERDPRVRGAVVLGVPDPRLGAVPVALVELRPGTHADAASITAAAARSLAGYEVPTQVHVVAELPRTPSGKVDLRAAETLLAGRADA